jgi:hypothetical protein
MDGNMDKPFLGRKKFGVVQYRLTPVNGSKALTNYQITTNESTAKTAVNPARLAL